MQRHLRFWILHFFHFRLYTKEKTAKDNQDKNTKMSGNAAASAFLDFLRFYPGDLLRFLPLYTSKNEGSAATSSFLDFALFSFSLVHKGKNRKSSPEAAQCGFLSVAGGDLEKGSLPRFHKKFCFATKTKKIEQLSRSVHPRSPGMDRPA